MMHFAICLPGWNSLDSVRRIHNYLEGAALVFFALLVFSEALAHLSSNEKNKSAFDRIGIVFFAIAVLAEIAAYPYGQRNDSMSEQIIGSLDDEVKLASNKVKLAQEKADDASTAAGKAEGKAEKAEMKAEALDHQLDSEEIQLQATKAGLDAANTEFTEVEAKRQELETALKNLAVCNAPRVIPNWFVNGKSFVDQLLPFKGYQAILMFVSDPEARRAASNIEEALKSAGWTVLIIPPPSHENLLDGVLVESYSGANSPHMQWGERMASMNAALAFVDFLHSYNWQAKWMDGLSGDTEIVPRSIMIKVGLYPSTEFVTPPALKKAEDAFVEGERKNRAAMRAESLQRINKYLETLSPQEAAVAKKAWETRQQKIDAEIEAAERRYGDIQPCQPLSSFTPHL